MPGCIGAGGQVASTAALAIAVRQRPVSRCFHHEDDGRYHFVVLGTASYSFEFGKLAKVSYRNLLELLTMLITRCCVALTAAASSA
jgi:hypothetical protein